MKEFKAHDQILAKTTLAQASIVPDEDSELIVTVGPKNPDTPEDQQREVRVGYTKDGKAEEHVSTYTRLQIAEVLASKGITYLVIRGGDFSHTSAIGFLREDFGINITEEDLIAVEAVDDETWHLLQTNFEAHHDSKLYQGGLLVNFLPSFPGQTEAILVSQPGIEMVTSPDNIEIDAPQVNNAMLSTAEVRNDGALLRKKAGGNGGFSIRYGHEISLALTARQGTDPAPETELSKQSIYLLDGPVGTAWTPIVSIAMQGDRSKATITDLYDVFLEISAQVEGGELNVWTLVRNGNRLEWQGTGGQIVEVSGNLSVMQATLDTKALTKTLALVSPEGIGSYVLKLSAYRKRSIMAPFVSQIMVDLRPAIKPAEQA